MLSEEQEQQQQQVETEEKTCLFVYGSLLCRDVLIELIERVPLAQSAVLLNYKICCVKDKTYPAIIPSSSENRVVGVVLMNLTSSEISILRDFEGDEYKLSQVNVNICEVESFKNVNGIVKFSLDPKSSQNKSIQVKTFEWNLSEEKLDGDSKWHVRRFLTSGDEFETFIRMTRRTRKEYQMKHPVQQLTLNEYFRVKNERRESIQQEKNENYHQAARSPISVTNPYLTGQGFVAYTVHSEHGSVLRRYKEFEHLHEKLSEFGNVPSLPGKKIFRKKDYQFLEERRSALEMWLNSLISHPIFTQSESLHSFLYANVGKSEKGLIVSKSMSKESQEKSEIMVTYCNVKIFENDVAIPIAGLQFTNKSFSVFHHQSTNRSSVPIYGQNILGAESFGNTVCVYISVVSPFPPTREPLNFLFECHSPAQAFDIKNKFLLLSRKMNICVNDSHSQLLKTRKYFLVFVSPASGKKKAIQIWREQVCGMLEASGSLYDEIITTHRDHAREFSSNMSHPLGHYSGVVIIGGDGIAYEYLQGIFSRDDLYSAHILDIPIVLVPAGSGNSMALNTGNTNVETSIYAILHGRNVNCDITKLHFTDTKSQIKSQAIYSVVSFSWGLFANVDVGTNAFRWLGESRFVYGTLKETITQKPVLARVHILKKKSPGVRELQETRTPKSVFERNENGELVFDANKGWVTIEGKFLLLVICNVSFLSSDCLMAPSAVLNDGYLDFVYIVNDTPSRAKLLDLMSQLREGTHISNFPFVKCEKIRAYYIEPLEKDSEMVVDGEIAPFGVVQGEQFQAVATVKCQPHSE